MFWPERSAGMASFRPFSRASAGTVEPNCSSTSTPVDRGVGAGAHGLQQALEDQVLGVGDDRRLLGVRLALDPEELLLEGAAMVEGEDVELLVVSEVHGSEYSRAASGGLGQVHRMDRR